MSLYGDFSQSRFDAAPCAALTSQGVRRGVGNFETNTALFYLFCLRGRPLCALRVSQVCVIVYM